MSNEEKPVLKGKCYCGAVTLEAFCAPTAKALCHCTACRRSTGSIVFVTLFPADKLNVEGELTAIDPKQSGFFVGYPEGDNPAPHKDIIDNKTKLFQRK